MTYVLDASALVALYKEEEGKEAAEYAPIHWFRPPKEKQDKKNIDVNAIIAELAEAKRRIAELEAPL